MTKVWTCPALWKFGGRRFDATLAIELETNKQVSEFSSEQSKMTLVFAWADDVISSRSCAVKLLQTSTASFSHGSPIPGRDLTLNDKELKKKKIKGIYQDPNRHWCLIECRQKLFQIPGAGHRLQRAVCRRWKPPFPQSIRLPTHALELHLLLNQIFIFLYFFFITQSSRFDQTGERIQKSLMTLITRTQFWRVLALAWNHLARRRSASECKQSLVFRRPSLIAAASFMSTSLPGWQSLTR